MGLPLVTKAEYKAYAGITSTNSDAVIDSLIPKISELVKNICNRAFVDWATTGKVEYFDGGTSSLIPSEWPLIAVTSLEKSVDYGNTYTALVLYTDYAISKVSDTIIPIGYTSTALDTYYYTPSVPIFSEAINGYRLTYTAGYTNIPEDLKLALLDLITYYIKHDSAIHSNRAPGGNTVQIEYVTTTSLPAHIRRVLDLYSANYN